MIVYTTILIQSSVTASYTGSSFCSGAMRVVCSCAMPGLYE
jgi:hypothetical protein